MFKIQIRQAKLNDAQMLTELSYETFYDAFREHPQNTPADMLAYMEKAFNIKTVSAELSEENSIFLIAESENKAVGYAKVMLGTFEEGIEAERPIELNRLYAKTAFIGRGVGQKLMDQCFEIAVENNCDMIWLGVWEYNPRAIRFYEKQGFYKVGSHVFQLGSDPQIDLLMQKNL